MSCSGGSGRFLSGAGLVFIIAFIQEGFKPGNDQVFFEEMVARVHIGETEKGVPVQTCGQLATVPALGRVRKPGLVMVLEMIRRPGHTVGCGDELEVPVQAAFRANDRARSESRHDVREVELFPKARNEVADGVGSGTHAPAVGHGHGFGAFQRAAQKVVIHEGKDIRVQAAQNHHGFRSQGEAAEDNMVFLRPGACFHPIQNTLVRVGGCLLYTSDAADD